MDDDAAEVLGRAIGSNDRVLRLNLVSNYITDPGMVRLIYGDEFNDSTGAFTGLKDNKSLQHVVLSRNRYALFVAVSTHTNTCVIVQLRVFWHVVIVRRCDGSPKPV